MNPLDQLKSVLCDPEGKCCISGSDEDRATVDRALQALAAAVPDGFQNFPASNSSAAEDAMGKVWEERNFPCNPRAAARCGWEAAHRVIKSLIAAAPGGEAMSDLHKTEREGVAADREQWAEYLKEGQTPFERFQQERKDLDALMGLYQKAVAAAVPKMSTGWVAPKDQYAVPVLFNPYTGEPRDARDVQSDPQGILIQPPGNVAMLAASPEVKP